MKENIIYVCENCGAESLKWAGRCSICGQWNTLREIKKLTKATKVTKLTEEIKPEKLREVKTEKYQRIPTKIEEFDRVLGGGIVPGTLILLGGEPGIGKCITGDTRLLDPTSGAFLPITIWARRQRHVVSLNEATHRLIPQQIIAFHDQGVRSIIEVKTRLGRILRCTSNHPLLTPDGWRAAGDLSPGMYIASPRQLPYFGNDTMPEHKVKLIAYVLSDGSATNSIDVTTADPEIERDLIDLARRFGLELTVYPKRNSKAKTFRFIQPVGRRAEARKRVSRALRSVQATIGLAWAEWARLANVSYGLLNVWRRAEAVPSMVHLQQLAKAVNIPVETLASAARDQAEMRTSVAQFLESIGLRFMKARTKAVPECIFRLPKSQMALFLKVVFSCDGSVYITRKRQPGVSYSTTSYRLAQDIQHLLLRFGLVTRIRTKLSKVNSQSYTAYEIQLLGIPEVKKFLDEIGIWGRRGVQEKIRALPNPQLPSTHSSPYLKRLSGNDIYWDEIQSIKSAGKERVYDLTMPTHANFVANDLIVHNSTLLLQAADKLQNLLYISGEESKEQLKLRAERLGIKGDNLYLLTETDIESVIQSISSLFHSLTPSLLIIDSIQTMYDESFPTTPGSIIQVRECALRLQQFCKSSKTPVIITGHVTKEGTVAGPKTLEHLVDVVLYLEGERFSNMRLLHGTKNRFGPTEEVGVFEMTDKGLFQVKNPSKVFLEERREAPGSAITSVLSGSRAFLVEIQALISKTPFGYPKRTVSGYDYRRLDLLLAVLEKRIGLPLFNFDVYVNIVGGMRIEDRAADLAVCSSIFSIFKNKIIKPKTVLIGEVGLSGEIRNVAQLQKRIKEAKALGFKNIIGPEAKTLEEALKRAIVY